MSNGEFTCAQCRRTFNKGRSDKVAMEELKQRFGEIPDDELVVICDDCYNVINPADHPEVVEAVKRIIAARKHGITEGDA